MNDYVIEMENVCKGFNGVEVLKNVDFNLKRGEARALVGGNGAGKSTLMKILTGVYKSDSGSIKVDGEAVTFANPKAAKTRGIAMIFQELSLIPTLTVSDNIFLTSEKVRSKISIDYKKQKQETRELLAELEIPVSPDDQMSDLSVGNSQLVEIAKALSKHSKILVMDEPTASLSDKETENLFKLIRKCKKEGVSIVYISHRMGEIFQIADSISVLKDGEMISTHDTEDTNLNQVILDMIGKEANEEFIYHKRDFSNEVVLNLENVNIGNTVKNFSMHLHRGEILGIAGLMGSGRTEILEYIFGLENGTGDIEIEGNIVKINNVRDSVNSGIALVPDDRRRKGLVLMHSLSENFLLPKLSRKKKTFHISKQKTAEQAVNTIGKYNIKTSGYTQQTSLLSGGNQQKLVISKWLELSPRLLLLDEPTAGVDIGAKVEIIELIRSYANQGNSVIIVSSELQELIAISDSIITLQDGVAVEKIKNDGTLNEEELQYEIQHQR